MEQNYFITNNSSKFIEVGGEDRTNFLQGLITNDIKKCHNTNGAIYACFLSPQGKFIADFFIFNYDDYYLIEIHEKFLEVFYSKIEMYILRSKVNIRKINNLTSLILFSEKLPIFKNNPIFFTDPRNENLGVKIYMNESSDDINVIKRFKAYEYDQYKKILIKNLIPNSAYDLIENKSLLLENNFQNINAIDWNKGCYIGQEITARMKYRSLLKKKLYLLELLSGNINNEDILINQDLNIGHVVSKVDKYVLCMLKINLVENKKQKKEKILVNQFIELKFL